MKPIKVLLFSLFLFCATNVIAQNQFTAGFAIGPQVMSPSDTESSTTGFGFFFYGDYNFNPNMAAGIQIGYYIASSKDEIVGSTIKTSYSLVPILFNFKYKFDVNNEKLHPFGKIGIGFVPETATVETDIGGSTSDVSVSDTDFGFTIGGGLGYDIDDKLGVFFSFDYLLIQDLNNFGFNFGVSYDF